MPPQPTIFIVDDDPLVRSGLAGMGRLLKLPVAEFPSASEFLQQYDPAQPGCLIVDVQMPGMTGLELQRKLAADGRLLPVIVISGHADVKIAVEAMRGGALTFLEKPCRLDEVAGHVRAAVEMDSERRAAWLRRTQRQSQLQRLTAKEREVLEMVSSGKSNKQIANCLQLSVRAVEDRRSRVMKKLAVRSVVELVRFTNV